MSSKPDDTIRLHGPRVGERSLLARVWPYAAGSAVMMAAAFAGAWWTLAPTAPVPQQASVAPAPAVQPAPAPQVLALAPPPQAAAPAPAIASAIAPPPVAPLPVVARPFSPAPVTPAPQPAEPTAPPALPPLASEAQILADAPEQIAIYRFAPQPAIVVLQFPTLSGQAQMLNRVAALVEKQGFPRDRVVPHAELDSRIRASGLTPDTFYYGHDYRADDVAHFFTLASELNGDEQQLQTLVGQLGWREHGALGALISLVRESSVAGLDPAARATILRHELSHGVYFTDAAYAQYCRRFWQETLTAKERAQFSAFLGKEGYDPSLEDLVINETQAYLIHTRDRRFFRPAAVGLTQERADELRQRFVAGMPPGWLRDAAAATPLPALTPVRAP